MKYTKSEIIMLLKGCELGSKIHKSNWKLGGGDTGKYKEYFESKYRNLNLKVQIVTDKCVCNQKLKSMYYLINTDVLDVLIIGACCMKKIETTYTKCVKCKGNQGSKFDWCVSCIARCYDHSEYNQNCKKCTSMCKICRNVRTRDEICNKCNNNLCKTCNKNYATGLCYECLMLVCVKCNVKSRVIDSKLCSTCNWYCVNCNISHRGNAGDLCETCSNMLCIDCKIRMRTYDSSICLECAKYCIKCKLHARQGNDYCIECNGTRMSRKSLCVVVVQ